MRTTSSSTSSSDPGGGLGHAPAAAASWGRFALSFLLATGLVFAIVFGTLVAIDPYDTGRFGLVRTPGVPEQGPRTADASRGRDPGFDGAIVGNSHIQLISPAELKGATGTPFVSLAVPGTGPREQLVLVDYFLRTRIRPARALVLGIDDFWCTPDPALAPPEPFPFWLYDPRPWRYLGGLVRWQVFDEAIRRVQYVAGISRRPRARPDGYWNYDEGTDRRQEPSPVPTERFSSYRPDATGRFPAIEALGSRLGTLPASLQIVVVRPPIVARDLPEPGSEAGRQEAACREALASAVAGRPNAALVDWRIDRPETRRPENFHDHTHYRSAIARLIEADIAVALKRRGPG